LASSLLGAVEGFPDADMADILDIRQRLEGPRVHFRSAIATAAAELAADEPIDRADAAVRNLRVQTVEPALALIADELDALGARRTLLRVSSDTNALTATASLAVAALAAVGLAGVSAGLLPVALTPLVAAAAKEKGTRLRQTADLHARPYWLLHQTGELLARR
jgi:hypothetical protein